MLAEIKKLLLILILFFRSLFLKVLLFVLNYELIIKEKVLWLKLTGILYYTMLVKMCLLFSIINNVCNR